MSRTSWLMTIKNYRKLWSMRRKPTNANGTKTTEFLASAIYGAIRTARAAQQPQQTLAPFPHVATIRQSQCVGVNSNRRLVLPFIDLSQMVTDDRILRQRPGGRKKFCSVFQVTHAKVDPA